MDNSERAALLLKSLVTERCESLRSLARVHRGEAYWLNVVRFDPGGPALEALLPSADGVRRQTARWLTLGVSLGALLHLPPGGALLKGLLQLFEEYDFFCQSAALQSVRSLAARYGRYPQRWRSPSAALAAAAGGMGPSKKGGPAEMDGPLEVGGGTGGEGPLGLDAPGNVGPPGGPRGASARDELAALRPQLTFSPQSGAVIYERLLPAASWAGAPAGGAAARLPLDHSATLSALCETLCHVYARLSAMDARTLSHALADGVARVDAHVQAFVLAPAARELQAAAAAMLAARLGAVDGGLFGPNSALAAQLAQLAVTADDDGR